MESSSGDDELVAMARRVIDQNLYMVLGTADEGGRPWVSPVFYGVAAYRYFYWLSSPDVVHSRNLAHRPELSIVVFDSRAVVGTGDETAVYMAGTAAEVPVDDLQRTLASFPGFADRGGGEVEAADLQPPAPYRLYRATVTDHFVLCPRAAGEPCRRHGGNADHRTPIHGLEEVPTG
jgi:Pyridoxamine 5'-phosphate oxidase